MRRMLFSIGLLAASGALAANSAVADSVDDKAQVCAGCHGENGVPQDKTTPVIWGQNEGYIIVELRDFKSGARKNDIMSGIASGLSKKDMLDLAAHFSGLKWPNIDQPSPSREVTRQALTVIGSIGCSSCHLDQYQGSSTTPRLAGQQSEYLQKTMMDFRDHARANNPGMSDLMNAAQPADLGPIAQYLASLTVVGGNQ